MSSGNSAGIRALPLLTTWPDALAALGQIAACCGPGRGSHRRSGATGELTAHLQSLATRCRRVLGTVGWIITCPDAKAREELARCNRRLGPPAAAGSPR
jgi:hypothetical protein